MKKKGIISFWMIQFIPRIAFMVVVFFCFVFLVGAFVKVNVTTYDLEATLIAHRLLQSPEGIVYTDPVIGRTHPYLIDQEKLQDLKKLDQDLLKQIAYDKKRKVAVMFNIYSFENNKKQGITRGFYNKKGFNVLKQFIEKGTAHESIRSYPISIRKLDETIVPGRIDFEVLQAT